MNKTIKVLLLADNSSLAKRISKSLYFPLTQVFKLVWVQEKRKTIELINNISIDIILLDLSVTTDKSADFVRQLLHLSPRVIIILLGSDNDRAITMQAISQGAYDVIDKNSLGQNWFMQVLGYNLLRAQAFQLQIVRTKKLHEIFNSSRLGIMISDLFGNIIYSNPAFGSITGYSADHPLGFHWTAKVYYDDRMRLLREWQDAQKDNQIICSDVCLLNQHNQLCDIRIIGAPIDKLEKSYGYVITIEDITERNNKTELNGSVKHSLNLLPATTAQLTLEAMSDAILSLSIDNKVLYMNKAASILTGWNHHEVVGKLLSDIFKVKESATAEFADSFLLQQRTIDCVLVRKDNVEVPIEKSARNILNERGHSIGSVLIFRDITQSQLKAIKMAHLAQHDPLTGLPNRLLFQERLNQAIVLAKRHNKQLAVLYLDIDLFKEVNDLHGHELGDKLLCSIANRMTDVVRLSDTVCRQGGDEFLILLSEIEHTNDAVTFSIKLLHSLINPHHINDKKILVHMSIGIRIFPHKGEIFARKIGEGELSDILIDNADNAMYQAKSRGHDIFQVFKKKHAPLT